MNQRLPKTDSFRPISAVNKLGRIKKNIIPNYIQNTNPCAAKQRDHSLSPRSFNNRIKSAHPLNFDRENLMQENISWKTQLNKIRNDIIYSKREITTLETELFKKDKMIENMMNESQSDMHNLNRPTETHLVNNIKKQYKELRKEYERLNVDYENTKKNIKLTKINELISENKIWNEQVDKLRNLYQHSQEQNKSIEKNIQDFTALKEALSKQDLIILNFQDNYAKMAEEIKLWNEEIDKWVTSKNDKIDMITKLKQKLKFQHQVNEKWIWKKNNVKVTDEYLQMKNKYESKLQQTRKDLAYYKDTNAKNERLIREWKQVQNNTTKQINNQTNPIVNANNTERMVYTSQPPVQANPTEQNTKILLLQSKYLEEKTEKEKLIKEINVLKEQLAQAQAEKKETKVILTNSFSSHNMKKEIKINEYEYFSDFSLNEFVYVLLKNLEANKIDMSIIESRVISKETLQILSTGEKDNYKKFISTISNSLCDILKIKQESDQKDVHSFFKTFLYNYYVAKTCSNPEEFQTKLLSWFDNINFYSVEQKQELNQTITAKLKPLRSEFLTWIKYFDENNTGYITFTTIKKIMESLRVKFKNEVLEYFIYVMKSYYVEGTYWKDLKYENIIKIIDETSVNPNAFASDDRDKPEGEDDDSAIEITNEEYLAKVNDVIMKICKVLKANKKTPDDYFKPHINDKIKEYKGIELIKIVELLKKELDIEWSHIEIFCLFTKVKPGNSLSQSMEDNIEEIIDYDKLKKEIDNCMKVLSTNTNINSKPLPLQRPKSNYKRNKLAYSDVEHAKNKETVDCSLKQVIIDFMKKHKMSFERFVFPVHCMMKLAMDKNKYNRYIDIEFFKHFWYQHGIIVQKDEWVAFFEKDKLLMNNERVNIDYLKYLVGEDKNKKKEDYFMFKPLRERPEASKIKTKTNEGVEPGVQGESLKMLQKELYGSDEEW